MSTRFIRTVVSVAQSPLNALRWCLTLACGHELWLTSKSRPKRLRVTCTQCGELDRGRTPL